MFNIYKKRIVFVCFLLIVCVCMNIFVNTSKVDNISVNATPITNRIVVLDAGHRSS